MEKSFLNQISDIIGENITLQLTIIKKEEQITLMAVPVTKNEEVNNILNPIVFTGSVEEIENNFISELQKPTKLINNAINEHQRLDLLIKQQLKNKEEKVEKKKADKADISTPAPSLFAN